MTVRPRQLAILLGSALLAGTLSGCSTMNEKMTASMGDYIPQWAGGLPADAPPRPGTAKYDEFMKERERQRLLPADQRDKQSQPQSPQQQAQQQQSQQQPTQTTSQSGLDPVH